MDGLAGKVARALQVALLGLTSVAVSAPTQAEPFLGLSEIKGGALDHDTPGLWSGFQRERSGVDVNVEALFQPWAHVFGGELKPAIGGTINLNGDTSKAYVDVRWEIEAPSGLFFMMGLGAAIHDGDTNYVDDTHKVLGSRVLFHPSAEVGYRYDGVNSVSLYADHMSDGWITRNNEGMDSIGVRFGHRFGGPSGAVGYPAPAASFAGPYLGALLGYQRGTQDWTTDQLASTSVGGVNGGGMIGYNWQSGSAVFGFEADATVSDTATGTGCIGGTATCTSNRPALFTLRPRFGWVFDKTLVYGTGGLAVSEQTNRVAAGTGQTLASGNTVAYGVAVGGGIETKIFSQIGLRAEVLHYGFPRQDIGVPGVGIATEELRGTVGRAGVAWYFN